MAWSAKQYLAFEDERTRAVRDLVSAIAAPAVRSAIDLGCGPGNSTEVLAARFPEARITGLDSSPDMIAAARARMPRVKFDLRDIADWLAEGNAAERPDVILANAVFQWIADHESVFPRLAARLAPDGALAIQMPDNLDQPSHRLMRDIAAEPPFADTLAAARAIRARLPDAGWYYALLRPFFARVDIWRTTYHQPLRGVDAIVEWVKGTGLRPFLEPLGPEDRTAFLERYRSRLEEAYPKSNDGGVLLAFPRLFIVAGR
jgi:trans-aconitate 2-methyltransferase